MSISPAVACWISTDSPHWHRGRIDAAQPGAGLAIPGVEVTVMRDRVHLQYRLQRVHNTAGNSPAFRHACARGRRVWSIAPEQGGIPER
jgi:hypothetical protein